VRAVPRFFGGIAQRAKGEFSGRLVRINGRRGGLAYRNGVLDSVYCLRATGDRIGGIYVLRNPEKLAAISID